MLTPGVLARKTNPHLRMFMDSEEMCFRGNRFTLGSAGQLVRGLKLKPLCILYSDTLV